MKVFTYFNFLITWAVKSLENSIMSALQIQGLEIHEFTKFRQYLTVSYDLHLAGNVKTSDLTSDQVTRVIKYVNEMLLRFKEADDAALPGDTLQSDYPDQQGNLVQYSCDSVYLPKIVLLDSSSSSF